MFCVCVQCVFLLHYMYYAYASCMVQAFLVHDFSQMATDRDQRLRSCTTLDDGLRMIAEQEQMGPLPENLDEMIQVTRTATNNYMDNHAHNC